MQSNTPLYTRLPLPWQPLPACAVVYHFPAYTIYDRCRLLLSSVRRLPLPSYAIVYHSPSTESTTPHYPVYANYHSLYTWSLPSTLTLYAIYQSPPLPCTTFMCPQLPALCHHSPAHAVHNFCVGVDVLCIHQSAKNNDSGNNQFGKMIIWIQFDMFESQPY